MVEERIRGPKDDVASVVTREELEEAGLPATRRL
jgi:hypothetical protein